MYISFGKYATFDNLCSFPFVTGNDEEAKESEKWFGLLLQVCASCGPLRDCGRLPSKTVSVFTFYSLTSLPPQISAHKICIFFFSFYCIISMFANSGKKKLRLPPTLLCFVRSLLYIDQFIFVCLFDQFGFYTKFSQYF